MNGGTLSEGCKRGTASPTSSGLRSSPANRMQEIAGEQFAMKALP